MCAPTRKKRTWNGYIKELYIALEKKKRNPNSGSSCSLPTWTQQEETLSLSLPYIFWFPAIPQQNVHNLKQKTCLSYITPYIQVYSDQNVQLLLPEFTETQHIERMEAPKVWVDHISQNVSSCAPAFAGDPTTSKHSSVCY